MRKRLSVFVVLVVLVALAAGPAMARRKAFQINVGAISDEGSSLTELIEDFVEQRGEFALLSCVGSGSCVAQVDYLGIERAIELEIEDTGGAFTGRLQLRPTGATRLFGQPTNADLSTEIEDWIKQDGSKEWFDFLRSANGLTPLALLSGNPRSTVARFGDGPYRRFGFDDSRSRMGYGDKTIKRWGGFELRVDAGFSSVDPGGTASGICSGSATCWAVDPEITLAGDFGKHVGMSFALLGQYRDYNGSQLADAGAELAFPITFKRPIEGSPWYWQLAPVIQAGGGASIDAAAGGLILGGGLVSGASYQWRSFEFTMANQIFYYGGLPVGQIGGYDFQTELSQLYFKNGLEATWWLGLGFYIDAGAHFTNFALDKAAVPWFVTPQVGLGWQLGRWMDLRLEYGADLGDNDYFANNLQAKLDFLF